MTRLTAEWLARSETQTVCSVLVDAGFQALFVGGCVRNTLLGAPVSDIDIATDARPDQVVEISQKAGLHAIPTGIDHGTITVIANHIPHEITTFRRDVETDGRRAVVAYSDTPEEDAHRRDFTMNALYATPLGDVIDPLGGLTDLKARKVRFIDDAHARIKEDYLRILRFFRFHAWYGDPNEGMEPEGLAACAENSAGIETLSGERIGAEIKKLLSAADPAPSVAAMEQAGVLGQVLPGATAKTLPILVHVEEHQPSDPIRRLAALGGEDVARRLKLSRAEAKRLALLRGAIGSSVSPAELAYRENPQLAHDVVLLRWASFETPPPADWQAQIDAGQAAEFPIKAADLMPELSGPALGAQLKQLEQRWIDSGFMLTRAELLA